MEKTKFELDCEQHCAQCIKDSMDICNLPGHCKAEVEMSRCGVCGEIYCSEEAMTELNICASCGSLISRNIDADNEIVDKSLFIKSCKQTADQNINEKRANTFKELLSAKAIIFPDKSFFDVKDVLIGVAVIIFFVLSQI